MGSDDHDLFIKSIKGENFKQFPKNIVHPHEFWHVLEARHKHLVEKQDRLCELEKSAKVNFLELSEHGSEFVEPDEPISSLASLRDQLGKAYDELPQPNPRLDREGDPKCRFVFIHAPNSWGALKISFDMLLFILTYHQVMPAFLDFIYPFGRQSDEPTDFFGAFRHQSQTLGSNASLVESQLGRSGCNISVCYNLRSAEYDPSWPRRPYSIRQAAVYHSFDLKTGKIVWIIIKGNTELRKRIKKVTESQRGHGINSCRTLGQAFCATLLTHSVFVDWACSTWRWYTQSLEDDFANLTKNKTRKGAEFIRPVRRGTMESPSAPSSPITPKSRVFSFSSRLSGNTLTKSPTNLGGMLSSNEPEDTMLQQNGGSHVNSTTQSPPLSVSLKPWILKARMMLRLSSQSPDVTEPKDPSRPKTPPQPPPVPMVPSPDDFKVDDMFKINELFEKVAKTQLNLKMNYSVLNDMRHYYSNLHKMEQDSAHIPGMRSNIVKFVANIDSSMKDLQLQQSRLKTLLMTLQERKALLFGILQYRSMEASNALAESAQTTTHGMNEIAQKTKVETVSMRVITLVTLFFLPITFISVFLLSFPCLPVPHYSPHNPAWCVVGGGAPAEDDATNVLSPAQTIMSTDIVQFRGGGLTAQKQHSPPPTDAAGGEVFKSEALRFLAKWGAILIVITFAAWYATYWWLTRKDRKEKQRKEGDEEEANASAEKPGA